MCMCALCTEFKSEPRVQVYYHDCCSNPANMTFMFTFHSHSIFVQTYFVEKKGRFWCFAQFYTSSTIAGTCIAV